MLLNFLKFILYKNLNNMQLAFLLNGLSCHVTYAQQQGSLL